MYERLYRSENGGPGLNSPVSMIYIRPGKSLLERSIDIAQCKSIHLARHGISINHCARRGSSRVAAERQQSPSGRACVRSRFYRLEVWLLICSECDKKMTRQVHRWVTPWYIYSIGSTKCISNHTDPGSNSVRSRYRNRKYNNTEGTSSYKSYWYELVTPAHTSCLN